MERSREVVVNGMMQTLINSSQNGFRFRYNSLLQSRRRMIMETRIPSAVARPKKNRRNPERILSDARRSLNDFGGSSKVFNA
jgi:hypothetical protein